MSANLPESVRARLNAASRKNAWENNRTLARYATEGFLRRLGASPHRDDLTIKGGNLFVVWLGGVGYRPTLDTDFLCRGDASPRHLAEMFRDIAAIDCSAVDGLVFDASSLEIEPIRARTQYGGSQISLLALLGRTRIVLHFDVGIGDAVWPPPKLGEFPALLDAPAPRIRMYPKEAAIAEKLHAMVEHGELNSRMKDFYDVWFLASHFAFEWATLRTALEKSLSRRGVWPLPEVPLALTPGFADAPPRLSLWSGFVRRTRLQDSAPTFPEAVATIRAFLLPVLFPPTPVPKDWTPGNGWMP